MEVTDRRHLAPGKHCRKGEREEDEDEAVEESMKELLFFELECRQENGNHEPNLCVVQDEAGEEWIFQGDKTIDEFCEWLFMTNTQDARSWPITSKAMTVILFCNIYASRASSTM